MIRLYLDCGCVFVTGFLTEEELRTGRSYCPSHKSLDQYGYERERYSKIEKAFELRHGGSGYKRFESNYWHEYKQIYPPLISVTDKIEWDKLETI